MRLGNLTPSQQVGALGEETIARWLIANGWSIVARRWHCRWGELDLVITPQPLASAGSVSIPLSLVFVEVKTRGARNWDADGALAISAAKQTKLWRAVRAFLARHPQYTEAVCRFDVALVRCDRRVESLANVEAVELAKLPWPLLVDGRLPFDLGPYRLQIVNYLEGAIEADF